MRTHLFSILVVFVWFLGGCTKDVSTDDGVYLMFDMRDGISSDMMDMSDVSGDLVVEMGVDQTPSMGPCLTSMFNGYQVGSVVFGEQGYIEYVPGDLPIILAAPHGGVLEPEGFDVGEGLAMDSGSQETTRLLYERLRQLTGRKPHMVINHIKRNRLNLNRPDARPNADHPPAKLAWQTFHDFVEASKGWITEACGRGHYFDIHTNGGTEDRWVEVGLGLSRGVLAMSDASLDTEMNRQASFYRALASQPGVSFAEIIRGPTSIGGLLDARAIQVVPSPTHPGPGDAGYYTGGYNSVTHGSRHGGVIDSTQLELHFDYINAGSGESRERKRAAFVEVLADVIVIFMETHYGFELEKR